MSCLTVILAFFFVTFTDKGGSEEVALSAEALELREQRGISLDSLDYAVCPKYVNSLREKGIRVSYTSRWMNGATIETTAKEADEVATWPFVKSVEMTRQTEDAGTFPPAKYLRANFYSEDNDYRPQLEMMNLLQLHEKNYKGQGVTIAVVDAGFTNLYTSTMFASIRENGQLLGVYDFADEKLDIFGTGSEHGSQCLGLIAGDREDYQGAANQALFYAIRSEEISSESPKEADNWIAAIEKCDSLGVWIATTSLGYSLFDNSEWDYEYSHLDGKSYRASLAAGIATRKGMLLCMAAGNSAQKPAWPWIAVPADADSILTVGAVAADSVIADFSSYGPTADGRIKPDVVSMGKGVCVFNPNSDILKTGSGTSFATPLIAGLAACLWSAFPGETNMQIRERIMLAGDRYGEADNYYGNGIPNAWKAYSGKTTIQEQGNVRVTLAKKVLLGGQVIIERNGEQYSIMGQKL